MSPTLVDFRNPATTPQMQSRSSSLQSSNPKGQISSSPSSFDIGSFASKNLAEQRGKSWQTDSEMMNSSNLGRGASTSRNANEGGVDINFTSPSGSRVGSEKPSLAPQSGLSKPRLVKVRKNLSSHLGRSTPLSGTRVDQGFNPFRPASESSDRIDDDCRMKELRDQWQSWNPFSPDSAYNSRGSSTSGASSSTINQKFGQSGETTFVFGANHSNLVSSSNVGNSDPGDMVGKSLPDDTRRLDIGIESENRKEKDAPFVSGTSGRESFNLGKDSSGGVFVFGSGNQKSSDFDGSAASKLPDEMKKLNIENSGSGEGVQKAEDVNLNSKANDRIPTFVFGSSSNTTGGFQRSVESKLPDEMKKLNIEDPGNVDDTNKSNDAKFDPKTNHKNVFVFGSSKDNASSFGKNSATSLPDEMKKKLNIEGSGMADGAEKNRVDNLKPNDKTPFVFGRSKSTSGPSGLSAENTLPDEMRKLNIGSGIKDYVGGIDTGSSSSRLFVKETKSDPSLGNSVPTPFTFQAGLHDQNSGLDQVPVVKSNNDNDTKVDGGVASSASFSFTATGVQSVGNIYEMPPEDTDGKKAGFVFTSTGNRPGTPNVDLKTPKQDDYFSSTGSLFAGLNQNLEFSAKRDTVKDTKLKKKKGKLRQSASEHRWAGKDQFSREKSSQENPESPGSYSPMDFSPCQETLAADQCSKETSVASDESIHLNQKHMSTDTYPTVSTDAAAQGFVAAKQHPGINKHDLKCRELNEEKVNCCIEQSVGCEHTSDDFVSAAENECSKSESEKVDVNSYCSVSTAEADRSFCSNIERKEGDAGAQFCFVGSEDSGEANFTFAASSSGQGHVSAAKRGYRKKNRMKVGQDSYTFTPTSKVQVPSPSVQFFPLAGISFPSGPGQGKTEQISQSKGEHIPEAYKESEVKQGSISTTAETAAVQETCEKWRLRGNQAYANGFLSKAEDYYTRGVNCISPNETSRICLKALVLCYSNRAATRMTLGRMREALGDSMAAAALDPNFMKVQVRAANCYLALGEIEDAVKYFKKCLQSGNEVCLDRKLVIESSDGLQKALKVAEHMDRSTELLQRRTSSDAENALEIISEGLSMSPYSEKLMEMKAESLLRLRKYDEVIQLCEQTLDSAEKNSATESADGQPENMDSSESTEHSPAKLWRWRLISKSYFYSGKLEEALDFLERQEQAESVTEKNGGKNPDSLMSLAITVRELLRHKAAGNEAFQSGRHSEAVEHYTAALSCNVESRPFAAICICNRAAAYQALGQITDAIADCSVAIALDGNYPKAISRRATLHEMIRDYGQAASDLERLISILEKQPDDGANQSGTRSSSSVNDLRQARLRLSTMEEEAKKGIPLDMYLILGIEPSSIASDIKKAYRKAALRHHPDKAGQFLVRSDNGDDGLWKEICAEIHKDADRLFKMIGEAYAILSDPAKRSRYDLEEDVRNAQKKGNGSSIPRAQSDAFNHPFDRNSSRRQWRDVWRSSGNSHTRWSEACRSNRYS